MEDIARKDELYNVGGFDPDHPSGNVLDEFEHAHPEDPTEGVTVRHYDADGTVLVDRPLTEHEIGVFFRGVSVDGDALNALADASIQARINPDA